jgi:magnesium transporter
MAFRIPRIHLRPTTRPRPGSPPGTLEPTRDLPGPQARRYVWDAESCESGPVDMAAIAEAVLPVPGRTVWVDVQGLGDAPAIERAGLALGLDPLLIEDIVHVHQRAKVEELDDGLFVVLRSVRLLAEHEVESEQIALVLRPGVIVTFQERPGDDFDPLRRRLESARRGLRSGGAPHLAYALLDAVIDAYFPVLEAYGLSMDSVEEAVRSDPSPESARAIHAMRIELRQLRRAIWPLRELVQSLLRSDSPLFDDRVRAGLRDCHDHTINVVDFVEVARERATDLADLHLATLGERNNQIMRVLTMIATVFIPLTFLVGVYGMNFDPDSSPLNMPELRWYFGYPAFWGLALTTVLAMLWFFRGRGWLGRRR